MKTTNIFLRQLDKPRGPYKLSLVNIVEQKSEEEFLGQLMNQEITYLFKRDSQGVYTPETIK